MERQRLAFVGGRPAGGREPASGHQPAAEPAQPAHALGLIERGRDLTRC